MAYQFISKPAFNSKQKTQNSKLKYLTLLLTFLLPACAPPRPAPPVEAPAVELLLQKLAAQADAFHSLRGEAKVRIETGERSLTSTQVLLARKPASLRADTLSPFGNPVLTVAAADNRLEVLIPGEGRFLRGEASYRNLQRFTRLPLQLVDLVRLLLYEVPLIPAEAMRVTDGEEGGWRLALADAEGSAAQELLFDRDLRLVRSSYLQEKEILLRVDYGKFAENGFPTRISVEAPAERTTASLVFSDLELNRPIPDERFRLEAPAGYTVEPLP